ncbi:MAG: chemotaxis protein CheX [Desulfobulbales bacterium]|nr:chemotaxis protein CheX [Desulfobulbales bacterium]
MNENSSLHKALVDAVLATMENIAFEEPEVLPDPITIAGEILTFTLQVVSPYLLLTKIDIPQKLAAKLTQTIYRDDEKEISGVLIDDTVGEILNTITGNMMGNLTLGERIFEMGLPQKITEEKRITGENIRNFFFRIEDIPFCVSIDGDVFIEKE